MEKYHEKFGNEIKNPYQPVPSRSNEKIVISYHLS